MKQTLSFEELPKSPRKGFSARQVSYIDEFKFWLNTEEPGIFYCQYAEDIYSWRNDNNGWVLYPYPCPYPYPAKH